MKKSYVGRHRARREHAHRFLGFGLVTCGTLLAACSASERNFGNALQTAGAGGEKAQGGAGATKNPPAVAGDGGQRESSSSVNRSASDAGEAGNTDASAGASGTSNDTGQGGAAGNAGASSAENGAGRANAGSAGRAGGTSSAGGAGGAAAAGGASGGGTTSGGSAGANNSNAGIGGVAAAGGGAGSSGSAGAPLVTSPSCTGLDANCGAQGTTNCCSAHAVPGGNFNRLNNITPSYAATVSDFILDDYEITVGRFRKFVSAYNAAGKKPPAVAAGKNPNNPNDAGWLESFNASLVSDLVAQVSCGLPFQTWTDDAGANESRPINCLSWYTAEAFCIWDGGRLPTLAEWSYAAVGGAQQRYYPWSSPPNDMTISENNASYDCLGDGSTGCALTDLLPVGSKKDGLGRFLQADLSGNVSEWVQDWYIDSPPAPCKDCANFDPGTGKFRNMMGGSFEKNAFNQQTSGTSSTQPVNTMYMVGARCARN